MIDHRTVIDRGRRRGLPTASRLELGRPIVYGHPTPANEIIGLSPAGMDEAEPGNVMVPDYVPTGPPFKD